MDPIDHRAPAASETTALASSHPRITETSGTPGVWFSGWDPTSPDEYRGDIWELFEAYRRSANRYLNQYFEVLDRLRPANTEPGAYGQSQEISTREASEVERDAWLLKISRDSAVRDLTAMDEILDWVAKQKKAPAKTYSTGIAAWTFACSILALAIPHRIFSAAFEVGALAGALLFTIRLVRKTPPETRLEVLQPKIRGLIRSFEEGTIIQRGRAEVQVPLLKL